MRRELPRVDLADVQDAASDISALLQEYGLEGVAQRVGIEFDELVLLATSLAGTGVESLLGEVGDATTRDALAREFAQLAWWSFALGRAVSRREGAF